MSPKAEKPVKAEKPGGIVLPPFAPTQPMKVGIRILWRLRINLFGAFQLADIDDMSTAGVVHLTLVGVSGSGEWRRVNEIEWYEYKPIDEEEVKHE